MSSIFPPRPNTLWFGLPPTKLQQVIMDRARGTITNRAYGPTEITATLNSVSEAVESAYVLTPREALPKITAMSQGNANRSFSGSNGLGATVQGGTSEAARQSAALWLAIAGQLEKEEKDAELAKKKADAEKAEAERAHHRRLDEIADLYFGKDFDELGGNKASAVKEIYRLEEQIKTDEDEEDAA